MSEDLVQAAKAAAELEPAIEAFAEATGALEPARETTAWLTDMIRYRRLAHQAKLLMRTAEKVKASGLPPAAVSDKLLHLVLGEGPMEDDESMQDRWANLLANAVTSESQEIKIAYPRILSELEPIDAAMLDDVFTQFSQRDFRFKAVVVGGDGLLTEEELAALDNLVRLGLVRYIRDMTIDDEGTVSDRDNKIEGWNFTQLGRDFVRACRAPKAMAPKAEAAS